MHDVGCCCCGRASLVELEVLLPHIMSSLSGRCDSNSCPEGDAPPCTIGCGDICSLPACSHGAPRPEDDPANFEGGKRVRGPSESEVKKAQEERRKVRVARLRMEDLS